VPLLYCKITVEKINSFGKIIEFYVACPIIFIKLNKFETIGLSQILCIPGIPVPKRG